MVSKAAQRQNVRREKKGLPQTNIPTQTQSKAAPAVPLFSSFAPQPQPQSFYKSAGSASSASQPQSGGAVGPQSIAQKLMPNSNAVSTISDAVRRLQNMLPSGETLAMGLTGGEGAGIGAGIKGLSAAEKALQAKGAMRAAKGLPDLELAAKEAEQLRAGQLPTGNVQDIMGRKVERILNYEKQGEMLDIAKGNPLADMNLRNKIIGEKLDKIKKLSKAKYTADMDFARLDYIGKNTIATEGLSNPAVTEAAMGSNKNIWKDILETGAGAQRAAELKWQKSLGLRPSLSTKSVKLGLSYVSKLVAGTAAAAGIMGLVSLYAWGKWGKAEIPEGYNIAITQALKLKTPEGNALAKEINDKARELHPPSLLESIKDINIFRNFRSKFEAGLEGIKANDLLIEKQAEELQKTEEDDMMSQAMELENQKQANAEKNQAARDEAAALSQQNQESNQQALSDYQANKERADKEAQAFWAEQQAAKQASEEENRRFWAEYEANKEAYWLEYQRQKKK